MQPTPDYPLPILDNSGTMDPALLLTDEQFASAMGFEGYLSPAPPQFPPVPPPPPIVGLNDSANDTSNSWLSPDEEEAAFQYWCSTLSWASLPLPQPQASAPVADQLLDGPASGEYDADAERAAKRPRRTPLASAAVDATARETSIAASTPPPNGAPDSERAPPRIVTDPVYTDHQLPPSEVVACHGPGWSPGTDHWQYHDASMASTSSSHDATSTTPAPHQVQSWQNVAVPEAQPAGWVYWLDPLPPVDATSGFKTFHDDNVQYPGATPQYGTPFVPAPPVDYQWDAMGNAYPTSSWAPDPPIVQDPTYVAHAFYEDLGDAFGHHVQTDNTYLPPAQPQSRLRAPDQPVASSSKTPDPGNCQAPKKKGKPWKTSARGVRFEDTPLGKMCATLELSKDTPGPFRCFLRSSDSGTDRKGKRKAHDYEYPNWDRFVQHLERCQPDDQDLWPRCHFCGKPVPGVGRAFEMDRHIIGAFDKKPCKGLEELMAGGMTTNGAIGDWLRGQGLPIHNDFLGKWFSEDFYRAAYWNEGRDAPVDLAGKRRMEMKEQSAAKKAAKANKAKDD